jgi:hypothetical protein
MAGFYRDPIICQYIAQNYNKTLIKPVQYVDVLNSCTEDIIIGITQQGVVPRFETHFSPNGTIAFRGSRSEMERNDSPTSHAIQRLLVRERTGRLCSIPEED